MPKIGVDREGANVTLAIRFGGRAATLSMNTRAAGALEALISRAVSSEDDFSAECNLDGDLETKEGLTP